MATPSWTAAGQYYETCSCDFVCPCIVTQLTAKPTKGSCTFAMSFKIDHGTFGDLALDGLGFIIVGFTPAEMGKGNWSAGVIVDERANQQQRDAIVDDRERRGRRADGRARRDDHELRRRRVRADPFERDGVKWSVNAATFVSMSANRRWASTRTRRNRFNSPTPGIRQPARSRSRMRCKVR